jgi:L-arabinokinase
MVTFYISGHGYGHGTRAAALISALRTLRPDCRIAVRTAAPEMLFGSDIQFFHTELEAPIVESVDALHVDTAASAKMMVQFLRKAGPVIERELRFLASSRTRLIVGDIPFLAGEIARRASLPAVAIGNFTWDWIFEAAAPADLVERIRSAYSGYSEALRLPLSHEDGWEAFPKVTDVPLLTPRSKRPREEIRSWLGLTRTAVLIAGRSRLSRAALDRIRDANPGIELMLPDSLPEFSDLVRAADVVVSKIGYSTAAECIAERTRLLFPPRIGFREEEILAREVPRHVASLPMPAACWEAGNWMPYIHEVLQKPHDPESPISTNGAEVCAAAFTRLLR